MFVCVIWIQQIPIFDEQFWYWYKVTTSCKLISHFWTALKQTYFFSEGRVRLFMDGLWTLMFTISRRLFPRVALIYTIFLLKKIKKEKKKNLERKGPYVTFCGFWDNWRIEFSISKSIIGVNIKTNGALKTQKTFFNFSIFQKFARAKRALCVFHIIDSF